MILLKNNVISNFCYKLVNRLFFREITLFLKEKNYFFKTYENKRF